jgi:hypothetical protein
MGAKYSTNKLALSIARIPDFPAWQDHPHWLTGIQALENYHRWVETIVLPIAYEWIAENHETVYKGIPKDQWDDEGVVIAAAYQLVRHAKGFKKAQLKLEEFRKLEKTGRLKTKKLNPVWARVTGNIREATNKIFEKEKKHLKDTI